MRKVDQFECVKWINGSFSMVWIPGGTVAGPKGAFVAQIASFSVFFGPVSNFRLQEAIAPSRRLPCVFWRRKPETFLPVMNGLLCGGAARSQGFRGECG